MSSAEWAAWAQFGAGLLTFFAASLAVKAAYDAPKRAAEFAEKLRRDSASAESKIRFQFDLLAELMKHRGKPYYQDATTALNLIDIVYIDAPKVREAWYQFYAAIVGTPNNELRRDRYNQIIVEMVRHLGIGDRINSAQIQAAYYPDVLSLKAEVDLASARKQWSELHDPAGLWTDPPGQSLRVSQHGMAPSSQKPK